MNPQPVAFVVRATPQSKSHGAVKWLVLAGAVAAVLFGWPFFSVLEVVRPGDPASVVWRAWMRSGETFGISYTHSVNRRPVFDTLRVAGDHLIIVGSRFDAFGAGMPEASTTDGTLTVAKDGWLVWEVHRPIPELTLRVGRVADHILDIQGRRIHLSEWAEGGSALTFRVRPGRMLEWMKGRWLS